MSDLFDRATSVFRDFNTVGDSLSGAYEPTKASARALLAVMTVWAEGWISDIVNAPTGDEAEGARYIVSASPSGLFGPYADHIAIKIDDQWQFSMPPEGAQALLNRADSRLWQYSSGAWGQTTAATLGLGTAANHDEGDFALSSRTVTAGTGLSGGGTLTSDITLSADVKTVAGRTGDVVIALADVSGAGTAASHAASDFDTAGAASAVLSTSAQKAANLSDLANLATARATLLAGNSQQFAFGDGTVASLPKAYFASRSASLSAADTSASGAGAILNIENDYTLAAPTSIASKVAFRGGKLTRGSNTVTFSDAAKLGVGPAFDAAGTGLVTFVRTPRLYVCDLGVAGDGTIDDANALAQAILSAKASKAVLFGNNSIVCNVKSALTIPPNIIFDADGLGIRPDATLTSGTMVTIDGAQAGYTGELRGEINGLHLLQPLTSNHADTAKSVDGLQIGSSNGAYDICISDLNVQGFRDNVIISGPNAYILSFYSPQIGNSYRRNISYTASSNSGETIKFFGGAIFNCNNTSFNGTGFYLAPTANGGEFLFDGTSFDYNDISADIYQGRVTLISPNLENNCNNPHIQLTATSSKERCTLVLIGGYMGPGGGIVSWTGIATETTNGRPAYILTSGGGSNVIVLGTKCATFNTTDQVTEIVKSGGSDRHIRVEPILDAATSGSVPAPITRAQNGLYISTSGLTGWTQNGAAGVTQSYDNTIFFGPDVGSRKTVSTSGNTSSYQQTLPCRSGQTLVFKAYVRVDSISAGSVAIQAKFLAPDGTTVISTKTSNQISATTSSSFAPVWLSEQVPTGASSVQLFDLCSSFTGTAYHSCEFEWRY